MTTPRLLQDGLRIQAERRPDAVALVFGEERATYRELEEASNRLGRFLGEAGVRRGDRVGLLLPKSPRAIVAMLGVLKAGAIYVPLDPTSPAARLRKMVDAAGGRWILAGRRTAALVTDFCADPSFAVAHAVGWMEDAAVEVPGLTQVALSGEELAQRSAEPVASEARESDPAHLLFTSGSTGEPKGVVITHANVLHFVRWAIEYFGTAPGDRISGHPPLHFDLSTFDIYGTLAAGAELHLMPPDLNLLPQRLAGFIRSRELTQWFSVPSVLNYLAAHDAVRQDDFPALRRLLWCGEVLPTPTLTYWMLRLPHVSFTNLYGPTEATIASSYYTVPACPSDDREPVPIGRPCPGEELLVLDQALQPVPPGEVGDLYIGGVGLSPGYWGDEAKTRSAFLRRPGSDRAGDRIYRTGDLARVDPGGLVYFLGRADSQIKSRGYRIELGEIEAALGALGLLKEYAVVATAGDGFGGPVICCAFVPTGPGVTPAVLRSALAAALPAYMLPARWAALDVLPKNANGKIDRPALREQFEPLATATA